ncbi:hypothetical protein STEG23_024589, partial [Scotinomys teguina]
KRCVFPPYPLMVSQSDSVNRQTKCTTVVLKITAPGDTALACVMGEFHFIESTMYSPVRNDVDHKAQKENENTMLMCSDEMLIRIPGLIQSIRNSDGGQWLSWRLSKKAENNSAY